MIPDDHDEVDMNDYDPDTDRQQNHRYIRSDFYKPRFSIYSPSDEDTKAMMMMMKVMVTMVPEYSVPLSNNSQQHSDNNTNILAQLSSFSDCE